MLPSCRVLLFHLVLLLPCVLSKDQPKCPAPESILPCRCHLNAEEYRIWCSHSDLPHILQALRALSQYLTVPIDELILENNYLPALSGRAFNPLKIRRLMLRNNGIERVSNDWLSGTEKSLVELFVVEPNLRTLPDDSLLHLEVLQAITLKANLMKRLPIISGLESLKYVQVEALSLLEVSGRNLKSLPKLEKLHIHNCPRLNRLEANFLQDLTRLLLVNISHCGINWIHPRAFTRLENLKDLALSGNKISDVGMVGRACRDLPHLEIIYLDNNYIDRISEGSFVDLPELKKLYLSNNHISEIQRGAFHHMPSLKSLDLNKNMVRRIHPESFLQRSGSGLEELWLMENDISHISELRSLLDALPRLVFLDLSYNNLEAIPFGALRGHPTLEQLHLDYNKLQIIDMEAFMAMPALRELRLRNNSLSDVLDAPLWNLPSLKGLDLSGNYYRHLDARLLANLPSLRRIDLSLNELVSIEPTSFLMNTALEHVNLSYNGISNLHPTTFRNLLKLYEVDVRHNNLVEFVTGLPRAVEYLYMSHNRISSLPVPPSVDLDLSSLRMLDVSSNAIQRIRPNTLRSLPNLRRLFLGKNLLQQLDEDSLAGLTRLEHLDLRENRIMLIHPTSLKELEELKELNLRGNRLDVLIPAVFKNVFKLKKLDVSSNKLAEILPGSFERLKELRILDVSDNTLVQLPMGLNDMKKLKVLDLSKNRLKRINKEILNSLSSLVELSVAQNFLQILQKETLKNLQNLRILHLHDNEIESIESGAFRSLHSLKLIKLNKNKLSEIPGRAFADLPSLQVIELQENQIKNVSMDAFHSIPRLLFLNISYNQLENLEESGLAALKSLEVLDLSHNIISRIASPSFDKMEWLVELKINDNRICGIQGTPFDEMSRLRVLNLKNNKLVTLPEKGLQKLLGNIAVLDVDGNPLACSCSLLWLRSWLQEISSTGPRCVDGVPIRDMHLTKEECPANTKEIEPLAPGCEQYVDSQAKSIDSNTTSADGKNLAPSPEESDYFYDEYIDYHYNETILDDARKRNITLIRKHNSSDEIPTIYAQPRNRTKAIPKGVNNSPSTSGFTFFGVPLNGLNLFGTNSRKKGAIIQMAERKTAIVNKPQNNPPTVPQIETGGFIPILPGSGGFQPITNPPLTTTSPASTTMSTTFEPTTLSTPTTTTTMPTTPTTVTTTTNLPLAPSTIPTQPETQTTTALVQELDLVTRHSTLPPEIETAASMNPYPYQTINTTKLEPIIETTTWKETQMVSDRVIGTPLSALLVPGGLQPEYRPSGRPIITKVQSPHVSGSAPLQSDLEYGDVANPLPHSREPKNSRTYQTADKSDTSWYFANYNKTNLEPYIGRRGASGSVKSHRIVWMWVVVSVFVGAFGVRA